MKPVAKREAALVFTIVCALSVGLAFAGPADAATTYYAGPGGAGTACSEMAPCTIATAVSSAANGDDVVVLPGDYALGTTTVTVGNGVDVHGQTGQPKPVIGGAGSGSGGSNGLFQINNPQAQLRNLDVESTGLQAIVISAGTVEGVVAHQMAGAGFACRLVGPALIRDTVCWGNPGNGSGLGAHSNGLSFTSMLRNVTISGGAAGIDFSPSGATDMITIDAKNVIAMGSSSADIVADTCASTGAFVTVNLAHSNYQSTQLGCGASVSFSSDNGNQSALPKFEGPFFHEADNSPTIDAGVDDASNGSTDIDGDQRHLGSAPDIGADELLPAAPADMKAPQTRFGKKPSKRRHRHRATFTFFSSEDASTFLCKLDSRQFHPCTSPKKVRVGFGRHRFKVKAVDLSGNVDPKPAIYRWRVRPV